jgi:hypothetical protein
MEGMERSVWEEKRGISWKRPILLLQVDQALFTGTQEQPLSPVFTTW